MSFLSDYREFCSGLEVPPSYNTFCSLVALSALTARRVYCMKGDYIRIYPNLYVVLVGPPGIGKNCLAPDTPIIMWDGDIKVAKDVVVGDKLLGDDSKPRTVLSTCSGEDDMYRVKQLSGEDYIVNSKHVLTLKYSGKDKFVPGSIMDIGLPEYLKLPSSVKAKMKGLKRPVQWPQIPLPIDPYVLGYWLGDGDSSSARLTTAEPEVVEYCTKYAASLGLDFFYFADAGQAAAYAFTTHQSGKGHKNPLLEKFRDLGLIDYKHIPWVYFRNHSWQRLLLLAGLLDSDGSYEEKGNVFEITQKSYKLATDIVKLARSLGFRVSITDCLKTATNSMLPTPATYYRIVIAGTNLDKIPTKVARKRARQSEPNKDPSCCGITVEYSHKGPFVGWEIDGNGRFLLGDFTVTHNTAMETTENLLHHFQLPVSSESVTREKLIMDIKDQEGTLDFLPEGDKYRTATPYTIFATELSEFLGGGGVGMISFLTDIYSRNLYEVRTKNKGVSRVQGPFLNVIAGTTPDWITTYMRDDIISGGFSRRCLFVYETARFGSVPRPKIKPEMQAAWDRVIERSNSVRKLAGPFAWTKESEEFFDAWYHTRAEKKDPTLVGYYETKDIQLLKIAMLVAVSEGDALILERRHFLAGLELLSLVEYNLGRVFQGIGRNELNSATIKVMDCIVNSPKIKVTLGNSDLVETPGIPEKRLRAFMWKECQGFEMDAVLQHLIDADRIGRASITSGQESRTYVYLKPR